MDKNRIKHIIYYVFWVVICLGIIGAATYPFISDYLLAQKQMQQIERFDRRIQKQVSKIIYQLFIKEGLNKRQ